jgi:hypothetical protein
MQPIQLSKNSEVYAFGGVLINGAAAGDIETSYC